MKRPHLQVLERDWWKRERTPGEEVKLAPKPYPKGTKFLTCSEVASLLRLSVWSIYSYIRAGELEALPLKKGYRIPEFALEEFITKLREKRS